MYKSTAVLRLILGSLKIFFASIATCFYFSYRLKLQSSFLIYSSIITNWHLSNLTVYQYFPHPSDSSYLSSSLSSWFKGIHSRPDTNRTEAEGLSFHYPRLLHCLDQMLAVMLLSQHRVSSSNSSKTVRPRAPCGARCIGHAVSTWSAVSSEASHSQFGEGARPHLCMDEWNRPTPVRRRLSLTQAARGKSIPTGLAPVSGTKARSLEAFSQYSIFHL